MKKFTLLLLFLIALQQYAISQNTYPFPSSGKVGIGTTNPPTLLSLLGGPLSMQTAQGQFTLSNVDNSSTTPFAVGTNLLGLFSGDLMFRSFWGVSVDLNDGLQGDGSSANFSRIPGTSSFTINSRTSATTFTTLFTVRNSGNVGIGTTTPAGKMEIYNNSNNSTNLVLSADYINSYRWRFNTVDRGNAIDMDITASNSGDVQQTILTLSPTYSGRPALAVEGNWLVANNGNIGIGTTDNSNWQLATSIYKLAVNGSAIATSMTVKAYTNWPDYVFKPAYTLPTLNEVKTYIDQNHHLPEIPTEQQIEKDGLNLGEMNKLLVKKVEELTLYLIEMKKDMANLQEEQIRLKKKIKNISTKTPTK